MCMIRCPARLAVCLPVLFACSVTAAQAEGLRLGPQFGLRDNPVGLKLRLLRSSGTLFSLPAADHYLAPPNTRRALGASPRSYTALMADWSLNGDGLRATAGLVLRDRTTLRLAGDDGRRDAAMAGSPETYIGLGWTSEAPGARRWQFSADVGSFVSTQTRCNGVRCAAATGLRPESGGSGIRWTPYVAIGAQFSY